jgi:predicted outer membrane repeat protein
VSLAFTVEEIASYDITGIAFTVGVSSPGCNESFLAVTESGIVELIDDGQSWIHLESGTYSIDIVFYFDYVNQAHGTWTADYHTDSCDFTGEGTFTAGKGPSTCSDGDGDSYYDICGQLDCRNNDADIHPGATEVCDDTIDNDCDGLNDCNDPDCFLDFTCLNCSDLDADDFFAGAGCPQASDCDDNDNTVNPGATEICNNWIDDDCDGPIDEGCSNNTLNVPGDYGTIQSAINAAQHGDTVLIADGTYPENILFNDSSKAITVISQNGAGSTVIQGDGTGSVVTFAESNNSTLSGFTITNGSTPANGGGVLCGSSSSPTIENCIITNNEAAIGGGGIHCAPSSSPLITDSIIQDNSVTGANNESNGGGIHAATFSSPTITNCIIKNNTSNWNGGGLAINTADEPTIINCTFSNNTAAVNGGAISFQESAPIITNCTFSNNSAAGNGGAIACSNHQPGTAVTNSILWENPDIGSAGEIAVAGGLILDVTYSDVKGGYYGTGNMNADPLFVGDGDYHLQAASPCIDAGTGSGAPISDIDGDARPEDVAGKGDGIDDYDMGSDEYVP